MTSLLWRPPSPGLSGGAPGGVGGGALQPGRRVGGRAGLRDPTPSASNIAARQRRWCAGAAQRAGPRDPDAGAAGTGVARRGTSNMSSKCDVVVVGGGISGQWRLRALLPPPSSRAPTSGRPGRHAGRPWGGVPPGAPRPSVRRRGSRGSRACTRNPPSGEGFGAPLDRNGGLKIC